MSLAEYLGLAGAVLFVITAVAVAFLARDVRMYIRKW